MVTVQLFQLYGGIPACTLDGFDMFQFDEGFKEDQTSEPAGSRKGNQKNEPSSAQAVHKRCEMLIVGAGATWQPGSAGPTKSSLDTEK